MGRSKEKKQQLPVAITQSEKLWFPGDLLCTQTQHFSSLKKPMARTDTTEPLKITLAFAPQVFAFPDANCLDSYPAPCSPFRLYPFNPLTLQSPETALTASPGFCRCVRARHSLDPCG